MIEFTWQQYADWLVSVSGMDIEDAVVKATALYKRQYRKPVSPEEITAFWNQRK